MASSASTIQQPNRWLPYLAVFDMDLRQTLRSGIFRGCLFLLVAFCIGYLIHFAGGYYKNASDYPTGNSNPTYYSTYGVAPNVVPMLQFLKYSLIFGVAIVALLSANAIVGEKGNMSDADITLCRGVGRYQYFAGKVQSRFLTIMGGYLLLGLLVMLISVYVLPGQFAYSSSFVAMLLVGSLLTFVLLSTISIGAITGNTLLTLGIILVLMYSIMGALWLLPIKDYGLLGTLGTISQLVMGRQPQGDVNYNWAMLKLAGWIVLYSGIFAGICMYFFGRKDVG